MRRTWPSRTLVARPGPSLARYGLTRRNPTVSRMPTDQLQPGRARQHRKQLPPVAVAQGQARRDDRQGNRRQGDDRPTSVMLQHADGGAAATSVPT